jgi:transcriptional regulator with XRE-family HTH domain
MDIRVRVGKNIQALRKKNGQSQEQLAEACGLHRTYIGSIERGERNVSILSLEKIANGLEVDVEVLVKSSEGDMD